MTVLQPMLRAHFADCRWFWAWALVGCAAALGFVSLGVLVLAPVAVIGLLMASRPAIRRSAFGPLTGAGVLFLYVAWLQRAGPGTTCWKTAKARSPSWLAATGCGFPAGRSFRLKRGRDCVDGTTVAMKLLGFVLLAATAAYLSWRPRHVAARLRRISGAGEQTTLRSRVIELGLLSVGLAVVFVCAYLLGR